MRHRGGSGRILALDLGKARVGVALSDESRTLASPLPPLGGSDKKRLLAQVRALCEDRGVSRVLVGLPLDLSGARGPGAARAQEWAQLIADETGLEVELVDERLSTVEAGRRLDEAGHGRGRARRQVIDGAAAAVLLQAWLDGE